MPLMITLPPSSTVWSSASKATRSVITALNSLVQDACAVGHRRDPRGPGSAVAAVDRDVEASLRTGDRLGDYRPAVEVRSRAGSRIQLRLMPAARRDCEIVARLQ